MKQHVPVSQVGPWQEDLDSSQTTDSISNIDLVAGSLPRAVAQTWFSRSMDVEIKNTSNGPSSFLQELFL